MVPESVREITQEALAVYQEMESSQREGNWSRYGELLEKLQELLEKIADGTSNLEFENEAEALPEVSPETIPELDEEIDIQELENP